MKWSWILLCFFSTAHASDPVLRQNMRDVANALAKVLTPALTNAHYLDAKKEKEISTNLAELERLFQENQGHFKLRPGDWRLTHQITVSLVQQAKRSFNDNHKTISRQIVKALPGMCVSCHEQDQIESKIFNGSLPKDLGELAQAEYLIATRRPRQAQVYLQAFLTKVVPAAQLDDLVFALRTELQTNIHLKKDWPAIRNILLQRRTMFKTEPTVMSLIDGWIAGLATAEKVFASPVKSVSEVKTVLKHAFGNDEPVIGLLADPREEVVYLKLREELHRLLSQKQLPAEIAETYFWLAFGERAVAYNMYYSLADGYLKTCMDEWPKLPQAKKCLAEYQSFIEFAYSGSRGTDIPEDVRKELEAFRAKVEGPK